MVPLHSDQNTLSPKCTVLLCIIIPYSTASKAHQSMTKGGVTLFPRIKEMTLRPAPLQRESFPFLIPARWKPHAARRLNGHLARPLVWFWPCRREKGTAEFLQRLTARARSPGHIKKHLQICQHLQTFEKSTSKWAVSVTDGAEGRR